MVNIRKRYICAIWPSKRIWYVLYMFLYSFFFSFASVYRGCTFNGSVMRQSLVSPSPQGRGIAGLFYFSIFKALLKALHCGAKFVVKSLLNAPAPWLTIMTINKWPKSFWISFPSFPLSHGGVNETLQLAQWFQRIYKYIVQSITQKYKRYRLETSLVDIYRWGEVQCTRTVPLLRII